MAREISWTAWTTLQKLVALTSELSDVQFLQQRRRKYRDGTRFGDSSQWWIIHEAARSPAMHRDELRR